MKSTRFGENSTCMRITVLLFIIIIIIIIINTVNIIMNMKNEYNHIQ